MELKCHKTKHWLFGKNKPRSTFDTEPQRHILFYEVFFDKKDKPLRQISVSETLEVPPGTHFFSDPPPPLSKFGTESYPHQNGARETL